MPMFLDDPLQTMAAAYEEMRMGEDPWVALGNFMNDWFLYATDQRAQLVAAPPVLTEDATLEERRWATFIAASVEYLCEQYAVPCPVWAHDPRFCLDAPWYHALYVHEDVRARLERTTPEAFKRRQIYCGDRVYLDKREILSLPASGENYSSIE